MTSKILCAVDGSSAADHAAACAADLAKETGAALTLVTVNVMARGPFARDCFWNEKKLETVETRQQAMLGHAVAAAQSHGIVLFDTVVISGDHVDAAVLAYAENKGFDHIVIGSHAANGLHRLLAGSTISAMIMKAHCPVTIVH
jgi:nucleotide-binding universal stress UspA family protein